MKIELIGGVYVATIAFEQRHRFRNDGWTFDAALRKWTTRDRRKVIPLKAFCVGKARDVLEEQIEVEKALIAPSLATDADIDIPAPEACYIASRKPYAYHPFQKAGVQFAAERRDTLLADPPGLGKTIQAIGLSNYDPSIRSVLVVAPAFLKIHWQRTWEEWDVKHLSVGIAHVHAYQKDGVKYRDNVWPDTEVVIVNPEIMDRFDDLIKAKEWDLCVIDEVHQYSNKQTRRAKCLYGGLYKIPIPKKRNDETSDKEIQADQSA